MRSALVLALVLMLGVASVAQDCENGQCKVAVPKQAEVTVKGAVSAPVKVVRSVRANKPVRSWLRKLFR